MKTLSFESARPPRSPAAMLLWPLLLLIVVGIAVSIVYLSRSAAKPAPQLPPPNAPVAAAPAPVPAPAPAPVVELAAAAPIAPTPPVAAIPVPVTTPPPIAAPKIDVKNAVAELAAADERLKKSDFMAAKTIAVKYWDAQAPEAAATALQEEVLRIIGAANVGLFTSDAPCPGKKIRHTVTETDTLERVARKYRTTIDALKLANRIPPESNVIRLDQRLTVYAGEWRIVIDREKKQLALYDAAEIFKVYPVSVGVRHSTPLGTFKIGAKVKNPEWKTFAPGDKGNILGTRLLRLEPTADTPDGLSGYGLQGTPVDPAAPPSRGSVRLSNADIEELFLIVPTGTPVTIKK